MYYTQLLQEQGPRMTVAERLKRSDVDCFSESPCVRELDAEAFDPINAWVRKHSTSPNSLEIIIFYVPWCGRCLEMHGVFCRAARLAAFTSFSAFNCERQCGHFEKIRAEMPDLVKIFPTVVAYKNGFPVEEFQGERNMYNLVHFAMRMCKKKEPDSSSNDRSL